MGSESQSNSGIDNHVLQQLAIRNDEPGGIQDSATPSESEKPEPYYSGAFVMVA
jgi:hypothetical protein